MQRMRSIRAVRRESFTRGEPFLHKRHRKSISSINLHTMAPDLITRMDMTVAGDEVVTHWSVIRHYSKLRISWDIVMGFMVSITAVTVPFRIAFDVQDVLVFYATDRISDVLFVLDVVLSFCTTYVDDTGVEIVDRKEIRRHYLKTTFSSTSWLRSRLTSLLRRLQRVMYSSPYDLSAPSSSSSCCV